MWKLVIPALAVALTGCGGGGASGSNSSASNIADAIVTTSLTVAGYVENCGCNPTLAAGEFSGAGIKYVVVSGWRAGNHLMPVKIYRLNTDGSTQDATTDILGGELQFSVNYPVVADFNKDGIDDIFLPGFKDAPYVEFNPSVVFLSRSGQAHQRVDVPGMSWSHASMALDLNNDGWLDVINSTGSMWINDQIGNFSYIEHYNWVNGKVNDSISGSAICAGDLDNSGTTQLVVTDMSSQKQDTWVFKFDADLKPVKTAVLPMPYYDRTTATEVSHDVGCVVADLNNDSLLDVVLTSTTGYTSIVQIYINQGNYQFKELTDTAMPGYNKNSIGSYRPTIVDFNQDGWPDIFLEGSLETENSNQLWLNNGDGTFTQKGKTQFETLRDDSLKLVIGSVKSGPMLPIRVGDRWNFVTTAVLGDKFYINYARTQWGFRLWNFQSRSF